MRTLSLLLAAAVLSACRQSSPLEHPTADMLSARAPDTFLIYVQNSGGPFTLALQPDNSLRGAGSATVNGRSNPAKSAWCALPRRRKATS